MAVLVSVTPHEAHIIAAMFEAEAADLRMLHGEFYSAARHYKVASKWYFTAAAASTGHKRTERYEAAAARCKAREAAMLAAAEDQALEHSESEV